VPRWQVVYCAVMVAVLGWAVGYVLCDWAALPRLTYFPYEREWHLVAGPAGQVPMSYVGIVLWGLAGSLVGAALGAAGARLYRRPLPQRVIGLLGAWALTAFLYAGTYYMWNLWPF
jgi:membrane protein DedA with SNARE-associated domain